MPLSSQSLISGGIVAHRAFLAASLTLSMAILWGESRRQYIQDVMHGLPVVASMACSGVLLITSLTIFRWRRRLAVYGFLAAAVGVYVATMPTL